MGGGLFVDATYGLALLAALGHSLAVGTGRALGWVSIAYGLFLTFPILYPPNGAPGYAAGGLILAGSVVLARADARSAQALLLVSFVLLLALAIAVWLDALGIVPTRAAELYRAGGMRRASGLLPNPIPAGEDATVLLGLALGLRGGSGRGWRMVAAFALPVAVVALTLTVSRGAILGALAVLIAAVGFATRRSHRTALEAVAALALLIASMLFVRESAIRAVSALAGETSAAIRLTAWAETPRTLVEHPFGGVQNDPSVLARFDGYGALSLPGQMGLVGGLPLLAILLGLLLLAVRRVRERPLDGPLLATLGWVLAEGFSEPFPNTLHTPFLWITLGLAIGGSKSGLRSLRRKPQ